MSYGHLNMAQFLDPFKSKNYHLKWVGSTHILILIQNKKSFIQSNHSKVYFSIKKTFILKDDWCTLEMITKSISFLYYHLNFQQIGGLK